MPITMLVVTVSDVPPIKEPRAYTRPSAPNVVRQPCLLGFREMLVMKSFWYVLADPHTPRRETPILPPRRVPSVTATGTGLVRADPQFGQSNFVGIHHSLDS